MSIPNQNYFESPEYHQSFEYYLALIATGYTPDTAKKIVDGLITTSEGKE